MMSENFRSPNVLLSWWKVRNKIVYHKLYDEKQDAGLEAADYGNANLFGEFFETYDFSQIFNIHEIGLFYWALPEHIHMFKTKSSEGSKRFMQLKEFTCGLPKQ